MLHDMTHAITACVWAGAFLAIAWMRHQRKMAQINAMHRAPEAEVDAMASAHAREVAQLRERVRVLERIATDDARQNSSHALAAQIDALKD